MGAQPLAAIQPPHVVPCFARRYAQSLDRCSGSLWRLPEFLDVSRSTAPGARTATKSFANKYNERGLRTRCRAADTGAHVSLPGINSDTCGAQQEPLRSVDSGERLTGTLAELVEKGTLDSSVREGLLNLFSSYAGALSMSPRLPASEKEAAQVVAALADRVQVMLEENYTFPSRHTRVLEPFNYFDIGQRAVGNLVDFGASFVGHAERILDMQSAVARGENVLLLANHQSDADGGVWAWMTRELAPSLATDLYYVAGDRVVTDSYAKIYNMGRNLICVHSKKVMDQDPPAVREQKSKINRRSVLELGKLFKQGGAIVWVAPHGGRDRTDASGQLAPGAWDAAAVMLLKRMMDSSPNPGHVYPMAMATAEIMPPPSGEDEEKPWGMGSVFKYHGVGISIGAELHEDTIIAGIDGKEEQADAYKAAAYSKVAALYAPLADAVYGRVKPGEEFTQPWRNSEC